ncbi:M10 family metallopeptidase C-terminal domain-containing protein [Sphingomonas sp. URHD0057]|uniref:M10 family metallopeptidase C-terminal domain-containing protein n=1 Tax=Sphingomonas sp. URHD0057 TaxID=1380389 RepID=UPI0006863794|nr:M10 family metallopeptidase C-terminal domain-containing protein [Sphingomonas sp. URHD0057]
MSIIYVSPTGLGSATGTSASNALPIAKLNQAIQLAGAGGTVVLLSDQGAYDLSGTLTITHGGTADAPVTVTGQDSFGNVHDIVISGTRPADYSSANPAGNEIFKLASGADNLVFEHMAFENVGTAFRAAADISNIVIRDMSATNVQRFFADVAGGTATTATVTGLTVEDVEVHGFSKSVIELRYNSSNVVIRNVFGDSEHQDGDGYAMGIHLDGTVHGVLVTGCTMENAVSSTTAYWNGDGFATEGGVYDVTFENCIARGNADAGFDLKSRDTVLIDTVSDQNAHNYRLWGDNVTLINPVGTDPEKYGGTGGQYQIQVLNGATVKVEGGVFADSGSASTIVVMDGGQSIAFAGTTFVHADGAGISVGSGISGLYALSVVGVAATGSYSTNGESLIAYLASVSNHAPDAIAMSGGTIQEDAPAGTLVGTVTGHDPDGDPLVYALVDDAGGRFTIDPHSGAILIAQGASFDVDQPTSLFLIVSGKDSGGLSYSQAIPIEITPAAAILAPQALNGTTADDVLAASCDAQYTVNGLAGNDQITTGARADTICGGGGNDVICAGAGDDCIAYSGTGSGFDTVDGGTGTDTIRAMSNGTVIGLHAVSGIEEISANGFTNVSMQGSANADSLDFSQVSLDQIGKIAAGAGDDFVCGSAGNDVISGGLGADRLAGGAGADTYLYGAAGESTVKAHDMITDFTAGIDRIDLSAIDASSKQKGNQAFTFIGTNAFSGHAGDVRVDHSDPGVTHLYADINGDKVADIQIDLVGTVPLSSSDLIL